MASKLKLTELLYPTSTTPAITINADDTVTFGAPTTTITNLSATSITDSGNLTFTGTGNRITGDFSNATFANRVAFQTSTTNGNTLVAAIPNGTSTTAGLWTFNNSDLTNAGRFRMTASATEMLLIADYNGTGTYLPMTFATGGSERMRLTTAGNLGLGVTPSAWGGSSALQIGNASLSFVTAIPTGVWLRSNSYFDGTNTRYIVTGAAATYRQNGGIHFWETAPSGTAGDAISFTQAMTLTADGLLGIRVASPSINGGVGSGLVHINSAAGNDWAMAHYTNQATGTGGSDGFITGNIGADGYVFNYEAGNIIFGTSSTERARIDSSGNLLVGTTNNASSARAFFEQTTANPAITTFVNRVSSQGNPGISVVKRDNDNSTAQIYASFIFNNFANGAGGIQGNGATGAQFFSSSDARLKENVQELEPQLPNIMALKPSKFDYIDGPKGCTGFIAQEMEQVYPDAIGETPDGYKTIGGISIMEARLVKAIQELKAEFDAYKLSHP